MPSRPIQFGPACGPAGLMRRGGVWVKLSLSLPLVIAGCGGGEPLASLTCSVSENGKPLSGAEVRIESISLPRAAVFAVSRDDGTCYVDLGERAGLPPGDYRITTTHYETADGQPLPAGEQGAVMKTDGQAVKKEFVFHRTLAEGANSLELKLEEGEEVVEEEEDPMLDSTTSDP